MAVSARVDSFRSSAVDANNYTAMRAGTYVLPTDTAGTINTDQNWGVPQFIGNPQRNVAIMGWLAGNGHNDSGNNLRLGGRVEISVDDATTYTVGSISDTTALAGTWGGIAAHHVVLADVNDAIWIRARLRQQGGSANNVDFEDGQLSWLVIPQAEVITAGKIPGFV